jgi:hypothetical protein
MSSLVQSIKGMRGCSLLFHEDRGFIGRCVQFIKKTDGYVSMSSAAAIALGVAASVIFIGGAPVSAGILAGGIAGTGFYFGARDLDSSTPSIQKEMKYCEVKMDEAKVSQDSEVLFTKGLADCLALIVKHQFNPVSREYSERRMAHIWGGDLDVNPSLLKTLFDKLSPDASFVIAFGTSYSLDSLSAEKYPDYIEEKAQKFNIKFTSRNLKRIFTIAESRFIQSCHVPGTIKLYPDGLLAPLEPEESNS